ncbi:MAG: hypothetical protein OXF21_00345 [bacterium]|nr:hypothetical protein [bacterium]
MPAIETKVVMLYISALLGSSLSEIEVCRVGLWGCNPVRGAWITQLAAMPMLTILVFTPMNKKILGIVSVSIGSGLLWFGFRSAHSEGSLTWPMHNVTILFFGSAIAISVMFILSQRAKNIVLPPAPKVQLPQSSLKSTSSFFSLKEKLAYAYAGALVGGLLGASLIYGSVIGESTFTYEEITFANILFVLIDIVVGAATPIIILFSQLAVNKVKAIKISLFIVIITLCLSLFYRRYTPQFGYYSLGYYSLWIGCIVAAFVAVKLQKQRIRKLSLF